MQQHRTATSLPRSSKSTVTFIHLNSDNWLIADTFTDRLARVAGDEQKAVKTTAFDLQVNPATAGRL